MTGSTPNSIWDVCGDTTPRDRRNLKSFLLITFAWAATFVAFSALAKAERLPSGGSAWMLAAVPTMLAVLVCLSYVRYLRQADELQRMIHLRALGLGFGGGWLALTIYPIFQRLGAPPADLGVLSMIMAVTYSIGIVTGSRGYR